MYLSGLTKQRSSVMRPTETGRDVVGTANGDTTMFAVIQNNNDNSSEVIHVDSAIAACENIVRTSFFADPDSVFITAVEDLRDDLKRQVEEFLSARGQSL